MMLEKQLYSLKDLVKQRYSLGVRHSSALQHFSFHVCVKIFFNVSNAALVSEYPDKLILKMKKYSNYY